MGGASDLSALRRDGQYGGCLGPERAAKGREVIPPSPICLPHLPQKLQETFLTLRRYYEVHYVYILQSNKIFSRFYTGSTSNLKRRFAAHNRGDSKYTARYIPWKLVSYFAFGDKGRAIAFERYLKTRAGRRFQLRHL